MTDNGAPGGSDGARGVEFFQVSGVSAGKVGARHVEKAQQNQPHAPDRRRRFFLAIRG
jgi:hypothetical protein